MDAKERAYKQGLEGRNGWLDRLGDSHAESTARSRGAEARLRQDAFAATLERSWEQPGSDREDSSYSSDDSASGADLGTGTVLLWLLGSAACLGLGVWLLKTVSLFSLVWFIAVLLVIAGIPAAVCALALVLAFLAVSLAIGIVVNLVRYFATHLI